MYQGKPMYRLTRSHVRIPGDGDSDSELMPIRIPNWCRESFRRDADQKSAPDRNGNRHFGLASL